MNVRTIDANITKKTFIAPDSPELIKGSPPTFIPKKPTKRFKGRKIAEIIVST